MSEELPPGWIEAPLVDVCESVSQRGPSRERVTFRYVDLSALDNRAKRIAQANAVPVSEAPSRAKQVIAKGDVLFSTVRVYLENIAQVPEELDGEIASTAFCVLRPRKGLDPKYLYYFVTSRRFIQAVNGLQRGNSPPSVQDGDVRGQRIPLAPPREQQRIASRIEELFSDIEEGERALERVQKLVERYRQSVLKAAVTGELTREWREKHKGPLESGEALLQRILSAGREAWEKAELAKMKAKGQKPADHKWKERYQEPAAPESRSLPELPRGWAWASLPQLGEFGRGKSKHRPRNDPKLFGGKYPFLQTGIVRASRGRITTFDTTYNNYGLAQSKLWPKGTICITIAANIAESGILEIDACFPDSVVGLVPSVNVVGEYIEFFIRTERDSLSQYAPATAQKNINLEILERVAVPLPPLDEQRAIYSKAQEELSKIDDIERTLLGSRTQASALRQATLRSAFLGTLVPQCAADEPASALLGRLRDLRAAEQELTRVRAGRSKTKPLAQVMKEHGMQPPAKRRTRPPRGV